MLITKSCFKCAPQPCLQPEGPCRFNELTCQQRSVHPPEKCSYSWGELWWLFSTAGGPRALCQVESMEEAAGWGNVLGVKSRAVLGLQTPRVWQGSGGKLETHRTWFGSLSERWDPSSTANGKVTQAWLREEDFSYSVIVTSLNAGKFILPQITSPRAGSVPCGYVHINTLQAWGHDIPLLASTNIMATHHIQFFKTSVEITGSRWKPSSTSNLCRTR